MALRLEVHTSDACCVLRQYTHIAGEVHDLAVCPTLQHLLHTCLRGAYERVNLV